MNQLADHRIRNARQAPRLLAAITGAAAFGRRVAAVALLRDRQLRLKKECLGRVSEVSRKCPPGQVAPASKRERSALPSTPPPPPTPSPRRLSETLSASGPREIWVWGDMMVRAKHLGSLAAAGAQALRQLRLEWHPEQHAARLQGKAQELTRKGPGIVSEGSVMCCLFSLPSDRTLSVARLHWRLVRPAPLGVLAPQLLALLFQQRLQEAPRGSAKVPGSAAAAAVAAPRCRARRRDAVPRTPLPRRTASRPVRRPLRPALPRLSA